MVLVVVFVGGGAVALAARMRTSAQLMNCSADRAPLVQGGTAGASRLVPHSPAMSSLVVFSQGRKQLW